MKRKRKPSVWVLECKVFRHWTKYDVFFKRADARRKLMNENDGMIAWRIVRYEAVQS